MQKELEELIYMAGVYSDNKPDSYYYKIDADKILALDGKIKTELDELYIEMGQGYEQELREMYKGRESACSYLNIIDDLKELENAKRTN